MEPRSVTTRVRARKQRAGMSASPVSSGKSRRRTPKRRTSPFPRCSSCFTSPDSLRGGARRGALAARREKSAWYTCIGNWDTPLTWLTFAPGSGHGAARHDSNVRARRRAPGGHDALLLSDRALRADIAEHRAGPADFKITPLRPVGGANASLFGPDLNAAYRAAWGPTQASSSRWHFLYFRPLPQWHGSFPPRRTVSQAGASTTRVHACGSTSASRSGPLAHAPAWRSRYSSSFAVCDGDSAPPSARIAFAKACTAR
jgi:hypothetical protein